MQRVQSSDWLTHKLWISLLSSNQQSLLTVGAWFWFLESINPHEVHELVGWNKEGKGCALERKNGTGFGFWEGYWYSRVFGLLFSPGIFRVHYSLWKDVFQGLDYLFLKQKTLQLQGIYFCLSTKALQVSSKLNQGVQFNGSQNKMSLPVYLSLC